MNNIYIYISWSHVLWVLGRSAYRRLPLRGCPGLTKCHAMLAGHEQSFGCVHGTCQEAYPTRHRLVFLLSRLCVVEPSICELRLLPFTHSLYHALKNDPRGVKAHGFPVSPNSMQFLASEISRSIRYTIPCGTAWAVLTLSRSRDSFLNKYIY